MLLPGCPKTDIHTAQFKTNVVGVINSTNAFLPLLRKGSAKKVVAISSAQGDLDFVLGTEVPTNIQYPITKAAMNMAVAMLSNALRPEGGFTLL